MTSSPVDLLADKAIEFGVTVRKRNGSSLELDIPVPLPDLTSPTYRIGLAVTGDRVVASEAAPRQLPDFCPERHINPGGSFCLGWDEADDLAVTDAGSADLFLAKLIKFLRYQERAKRIRRWPDQRAWAHGEAAKYQRLAREAATLLGPDLGEAAKRGKLTVVRRGSGVLGPALEVHIGDRRIYSVWEKDKRVVNLRRPCICTSAEGKRRVIRNCASDQGRRHREVAVELALALRDCKTAEERFWTQLKGKTCCRTMDKCPLK